MNAALPEPAPRLGYLKRWLMFREFVKVIDFDQLPLLDDTVTNISLFVVDKCQEPIKMRNQHQTQTNPFISVAHRMRYHIAEDPKKVIYPTLDSTQDLPTFDVSCLENAEVIAPTVSIVFFKNRKYAYKSIDRPIYKPGDTEHILNEIKVLAQFRGQPRIAQIIGLVVSQDPYITRPCAISSPVITGILLEYYSGGSLEHILAEHEYVDDSLVRKWAVQIGNALELLHKNQRTHLDIKFSNIVLNEHQDAILIDISGTGGYVWEWLSPEMQVAIQQNIGMAPASMSFDERVATDCWAYGKLLSTMAKRVSRSGLLESLQTIGDGLTKTDPEHRISLSDALAKIQGKGIHLYI